MGAGSSQILVAAAHLAGTRRAVAKGGSGVNEWAETQPAIFWHGSGSLCEFGPDRGPVVRTKVASRDFPACDLLDANAQRWAGLAVVLARDQLREVDCRKLELCSQLLQFAPRTAVEVGLQIHDRYALCVSMCRA